MIATDPTGLMIRSVLGGLAAALALTAACAAAPVRTDGGLVAGVPDKGVEVFKGVPFAAPPVGDLRWRPPAPAARWTGVRKADRYAPGCEPIPLPNALPGAPKVPTSEDCLYLNVWTPAKSPSARLPVMVWIYGGGFAAGATSYPAYDGARLARRGVVVVSVAYRLGPFGYLAHPELSAESPSHGSGTYGLMDQIAGLEWVRRNIGRFGGDPQRVTIFGESAGGIAVSMLAASPRARGLFQRAICESGGSFAPAKAGKEGGENVPTLGAAEAQGVDFLHTLGVASIGAARKLPTEAIVKATKPGLDGFWPALDGDVMPASGYLLYQSGRYNDVPALIGSNADEGGLLVPQIGADAFKAQVRQGYGDYAGKILQAYPAGSDAQAWRSAKDLMRDYAFGWPTWTWARLQSRTGKSPVFVYYFTHRPPYPDIPLFKGVGARHGGEIAYVFGNGEPRWSAADRALSETIMRAWVNFAATGDPNGPGLPPWPRFSEAKPRAMKLDAEPGAIPFPNLTQLQVLEGYYAWRRSLAAAR